MCYVNEQILIMHTYLINILNYIGVLNQTGYTDLRMCRMTKSRLETYSIESLALLNRELNHLTRI